MGKSKIKPEVKISQRVRGAAGHEALCKEVNSGPLPLAGESCDATFSVVRCANLRRDKSTGSLVAVGLPECNVKLATLPLLVMDAGESGRMAVVAAGNRLRMEFLDSDRSGYDLGGVAGTVSNIVMTGSDRGVVMTDVARYMLIRADDGKWGLREMRQFPALQFEAVDVMRLSADAEARELTGDYDTRSTALNDADTDRLGKDLLRCYRELVDKTVRSGMELQPVLARYRLEGEAGEVLYRSPVVMVGAPSGVQCVDELHCELTDDGHSRGVLRVAADVYRLRLRQTGTDTVEPGRVRRLVVETTLPVHPVDSGVTAANTIARSGTNGIQLRCFLPGASVTMVPSRRRVARQLHAMAMKGDIAFCDALTVYNPFDGAEMLDVAVQVPRGGIQGVDAEIEAVKRILDSEVRQVPALVARCRVPNLFVAGTGCVAGENVVWGDITAIPFSGYRIEEFVAERTPEGVACPWRAQVVTQLAGGSRCVATSWGQSCAPVRLSPILCAAAPDAVSMTVIIERDGVVYKGVYPMTPDETGTSSYYCDEGVGRIEPQGIAETFSYMSDSRIRERCPSGVLVGDMHDPFNPSRCDAAGRGKIMSMAAVDRRGTAWEFGRHRVNLFTDGGIYLLFIGASAGEMRCNRVDRRGVSSPDAVTETDDDRYPLVCIAGNDLVGLSRGNAVTLEEEIADKAVGWDRVAKELWLADGEGVTRIKESVDGGWREVAGLNVTRFRDGITGLLADTGSGIRDTALGHSAVTEARYTLRCDMPALDWYRAGMKVSCAGVQMRSSDIEGTMSVVSRDIDMTRVRMESAIGFSGEVNTPLVMGLRGFSGPVIDVSVGGEMAAGSELRHLRLILST